MDYIRWQSASTVSRDGPERLAQLVVVSADLTEVGKFTQYMDHVRRLGLLDYIFVNKGYTIVMDVNYRLRLAEVIGLQRYDYAIVILTAILPGYIKRRLRQTILINEAPIIRASTVKANIRYCVHEVASSQKVADTVERRVSRLGSRITGDEKGVVYCRSHAEAEIMVTRIRCDFYHAGIMDA